MEVVTKTNLDYPKRQGKVRDIYDLGDSLLLVATDRISAFDCVFPNGIPNKGSCLNQLSTFWFKKLSQSNHLLQTNVEEFPEDLQLPELKGRSVIVKKAEPLPIECIVRGYLAGSGWRNYQKTGEVCGIKLPEGLMENDRLSEPLFTPSTKAQEGHDMNISMEEARKLTPWADEAMSRSLEIYKEASKVAEDRGIVICDTKFEFGVIDGELILIDEVLTPDSSRFWYKADYDAGTPKQMDKEFVRKYLMTLDWDKTPPAPELPKEIVEETSNRYLQIYETLTGEKLDV